MDIYTLKKSFIGSGNALHKNDEPMACPYQQPLQGVDRLSRPTVVRLPCTDLCPLFSLVDENTAAIVCGSSIVEFVLSSEPEPEKPVLHKV
jgi:hypothetical protein